MKVKSLLIFIIIILISTCVNAVSYNKFYDVDVVGTLNASGQNTMSLNWTNLQNYPSACSAGNYITANGDSNTCTAAMRITGENVTGTYNFSGTIISKILDQVHNVKGYGAVGDNSNDDTTAIQAAIDAADTNNEIVYFPVGTYKITSAVDVKAGVDLICQPGAIIDVDGDVNGLELTSDHTIKDCSFWTNTASYSSSMILMDEPWTATERIKMEGVYVRNYYDEDGRYVGFTGTAMHFLNDDNGDKSVWGDFRDINIRGFEYGIKMDAYAADNNSFINANVFRGLMGSATKYFIYINRSENNDITANFFDFQYQTENNTVHVIYDNGGYYNDFRVYTWDFYQKETGTVPYNLTSTSFNENVVGNEIDTLNDDGTNNNYYDYTEGSFHSEAHFFGNISVDSDTGNKPVWITRTSGTDQALKLYTDDTEVVFESHQDEDEEGYGGFLFKLDGDSGAEGRFRVRDDKYGNLLYLNRTKMILGSSDLDMNSNDIDDVNQINTSQLYFGSGTNGFGTFPGNRPLVSTATNSVTVCDSGCDYTLINSALAVTPLISFHKYTITVNAPYTGNENVYIPPNIVAVDMQSDDLASTGVLLQGNCSNINEIEVKSVHMVSSVGVLNPYVQCFKITGEDPNANENVSVTMAGNTQAALGKINFTGSTAENGILCYSGGCSLVDIDLGNQFVRGIQTKHGAVLHLEPFGSWADNIIGNVSSYVYNNYGGVPYGISNNGATGTLGLVDDPLLRAPVYDMDNGIIYGINTTNDSLEIRGNLVLGSNDITSLGSITDSFSVDGNLTLDTDSGVNGLFLTRIGALDQYSKIYVDDQGVVFTSVQDEDETGYGGFQFDMNNTKSDFEIGVVGSGTKLNINGTDMDLSVDLDMNGNDIDNVSNVNIGSTAGISGLMANRPLISNGDVTASVCDSGCDYITIQAAVNQVPILLRHIYIINVNATGYTGEEDVFVSGIYAFDLGSTTEGFNGQLQIKKRTNSGAGYATVGSIYASNIVGVNALYLARLNITGIAPYNNELASISAFTADMAIENCTFSSTNTSARAIMGYGTSNIKVNGMHFTGNHTSCYHVKRGANIWVRDNGDDGSCTDYVAEVVAGTINLRGSTATATTRTKIQQGSVINSSGSDNQLHYGINQLANDLDMNSNDFTEVGDLTMDGNLTIDTDSGNQALWVTRIGALDQAGRCYVDDTNFVCDSLQDEDIGLAGGFIFNLDPDSSGGPEFRVKQSASTHLKINSTQTNINTELEIDGISSDGTGKAVCIKSDGNLGTCTDAVNATGYCSCS